MAIKVVLFDLGGVIIRLGDHIFPSSWLQGDAVFSLSEWLQSDTPKAFETGLIDAKQFAQALKSDLSLPQSVDEIIEEFAAWPKELFPGAGDLLLSLRQSYQVAALSNINELHVPRMLKEFRLDEYFDNLFFSNELHLSKPDPDFYLKALELLAVAPNEVVFFDDVEKNVSAARDLGINAHQMLGHSSVLSILSKY